MTKAWTVLLLITVAIFPAEATGGLECYEAPGTLNYTCIDPAAVRVNGEVRSSPLYMGGPKDVRKTSNSIVTNCARGVSTLQDRNGSNFGGEYNSATPALKALSSWLCAIPNPKPDKSLRQF